MELLHYTRFDRRNGFDLPRPVRSGLAVASLGLLPLLLGLTSVIRPLSGLVLAGTLLVAGALQWSLEQYELAGIRRTADLELRRQPLPQLLSRAAQWRAGELTSDRHRLALARSVTRTERDLSPARLPSASPLNRVAARPHIDLFCRLAERLAALDRPVTAQAVLELEELLASPESPLYARERASELRSSLLMCLHALEALAVHVPPKPVPATRQSTLRASRNDGRPLAGKTSRLLIATLKAPQTRLRRLAMAHRRSQR